MRHTLGDVLFVKSYLQKSGERKPLFESQMQLARTIISEPYYGFKNLNSLNSYLSQVFKANDPKSISSNLRSAIQGSASNLFDTQISNEEYKEFRNDFDEAIKNHRLSVSDGWTGLHNGLIHSDVLVFLLPNLYLFEKVSSRWAFRESIMEMAMAKVMYDEAGGKDRTYSASIYLPNAADIVRFWILCKSLVNQRNDRSEEEVRDRLNLYKAVITTYTIDYSHCLIPLILTKNTKAGTDDENHLFSYNEMEDNLDNDVIEYSHHTTEAWINNNFDIMLKEPDKYGIKPILFEDVQHLI